jgi:hypothetical protein
MWTKDVYQEQMLGYLGEVETEIERLTRSCFQQHDLRELYVDLDVVVKRLWWLIDASEVEWEGFRHPLEISCDRLQRAFYRLPRADILPVPAYVRITEHHESRVELWETAEAL